MENAKNELAQERSITLYSKEGNSDKVYQLHLFKTQGGFGLNYANGRRGGALKTKAKTTSPLTLEQAHAEFDNIVKSKKKSKSRYVESTDGGETLTLSENAEQDSGFRPQLLNEITLTQAQNLLNDSAFVAQEKKDGERRPVSIKSGQVEGMNRYGIITSGLKTSVINGIDTSVDMLLDTEDLGDHLVAFDILEFRGKDLRQLRFDDRYDILVQACLSHTTIKVCPLAVSSQEKQMLFSSIKAQDKEGIVFKMANAPYSPGRPNSSGSQLKFKLYDECSVLVNKVNIKRSVEMAVFDDKGNKITVGNVTIPANASIPKQGEVIQVRYLYAFKQGSLYQPLFERPRPDQYPSECRQSQLKYKPQKETLNDSLAA